MMTKREITDPQIQLLHDMAWNCYRLETLVSLAMAVNEDQVKRLDTQLAVGLLLQNIYALTEKVVCQLDDLQDAIGIVFHQDGWHEQEAPAEAEPTEQVGVD